jgi:lipopolysaccharide export system protein LptC
MDRRWIPILVVALVLVAGWNLVAYTVPQWQQAVVVQLG